MENWGAAELRALFGGSADVAERQIMAGGQKLDVLFLDGLTSGGDIAEQVLRPLMQTVQPQAEQARVYCAVAERVTAPEDAADKLLHGYCAVVFPGTGAALCFETKTDTRRGPSAPESENTVKGAKDAFTETMRINTSLLRRHLRSAQLRFVQKTVGLRSQTAVTVCFLADLTDPALVRRMEQRLAAIDIDGMLTPASVEEYVTGSRKTAFPLLQYTERPDTFCQGLLNGQVGLLVDGLPLGYLAPVDLGILMKSTEDRAVDYISATCLRVLRYLALLAALLLPGLYVAMATYHQEMIPTKLLLAIIDSKQEVPFDTVFEVIGLLAAFELLQEAGLHLPQAIDHRRACRRDDRGRRAADLPGGADRGGVGRDLRFYAAEPGFDRRHPRLAVRAGDSGWRGRPVRADGGRCAAADPSVGADESGRFVSDAVFRRPGGPRHPAPAPDPAEMARGCAAAAGSSKSGGQNMNRICIWLLAAASAVCLCMLPRTGTDAAKLLPAQVLVIGAGDGAITVEADNGAAGSGPTLAAALADMAECAEGTLFLDTAEHIVLLQSAGALLPAAAQQPQFRPAAKLYLARLPELHAAEAVEFLQAHPGTLTLALARAALVRGDQIRPAQLLPAEDGGMKLAG